MEERLIKTHLIITDIHSEYHMDWCGKVLNSKPKIKDGKPIFAIVGGKGRMELNTTDMTRLEKCTKMCTYPRGREAFTTDVARIYLIEEDDNEKLMGVLTHNIVKTFAPMYDKVGWE